MKKCQMTISYDTGLGCDGYEKCNRPAKFKAPEAAMNVEFVCDIHARSLDKMYKRTGQNIKCLPLEANNAQS